MGEMGAVGENKYARLVLARAARRLRLVELLEERTELRALDALLAHLRLEPILRLRVERLGLPLELERAREPPLLALRLEHLVRARCERLLQLEELAREGGLGLARAARVGAALAQRRLERAHLGLVDGKLRLRLRLEHARLALRGARARELRAEQPLRFGRVALALGGRLLLVEIEGGDSGKRGNWALHALGTHATDS